MLDKKVATWMMLGAVVILGFLGFFAICAVAAGATTTSNNRPNSLGVYQDYSNPNAYLLGLPVDGKIVGEGDQTYTNVRFQPYNTAALYDESLLFCGDVSGEFNGKSGPVVVTFHRIAHHMYHGVACYDLVSAFPVPASKQE